MKCWKLRSKIIIGSLCLLLFVPSMLGAACSSRDYGPLKNDEVYTALYSHLREYATTPAAKQYVGLLFPPPPDPYAFLWTERHDEIKAWKIAINMWPETAANGFENVDWFRGDFNKHFTGFFEDLDSKPTWFIYDEGQVAAYGRGLLVEADLDALNLGQDLSG